MTALGRCELKWPDAHAVVVGLQIRIGLQVRQIEHVAEDLPLRVAHRAEKDLLAVLDGEHVVDGPGVVAHRHRRRVLAGHRVLQHVLAHQEDVVLEQRRLHVHPLAGDAALDQRAERTDRAEHAAHDVVDAGAGTQRVAGAAGHVGEAAHHLHHLVERRAVVVGPGQEALVADVDEPVVVGCKAGVVEAELLQHAGLEVLDHDVGRSGELPRHLRARGLLQVDADALLVAVEHRKKACARAEQPSRALALDRLDLDDLGAHVGQHHRAGRAHHHVRELDDAQALERLRCGVHRRTSHGARSRAVAGCWLRSVMPHCSPRLASPRARGARRATARPGAPKRC